MISRSLLTLAAFPSSACQTLKLNTFRELTWAAPQRAAGAIRKPRTRTRIHRCMALFHRPDGDDQRRREKTPSSVREGYEARNAAVRNSFGETGITMYDRGVA